WRFIHNALPELDLQEIDTSTTFLGKKLSFPLLITSMSGGFKESYNFNANLASAAKKVGCALGLGSIRAALENESNRDSFLVARETAPGIVILANLGIVQIISMSSLNKTADFCDELQADGLVIHLNSLQEVFQPEGEPNFKGALTSIGKWVKEFPVPIIVKEVGQGLSLDVICRLEDVGVEFVDIAGAGGSNWISIEKERLPQESLGLKRVAAEFANWGEPTALVLENLQTELTVIASGGLTSPMDLPKALALGASLGGIAGQILKEALSAGPEQLIETLLVWKETLKIAMFGTGTKSIKDLIGNRELLKRVS
ncbi:type 2 isopentenyl-diphosphate Delta-isomerase, partial [bacterium]|nr:type 2 isopentenyl-diphosphate Delta-isomerase [bacterium]